MDDSRSGRVTRRVISPVIKSWKESKEQPLLESLVSFSRSIGSSRDLVLDLEAELDSPDIMSRIGDHASVHVRNRPSDRLLHRVQRRMGIYTSASRLSALVQMAQPEELGALLRCSAIWSSDFVLYPTPSGNQPENLPNPHTDAEAFAQEVDWSIRQETGAPGWLVTAKTEQDLDRLMRLLADALKRHGIMPIRVSDGQ